jgi:regulator of RNase E activity RraB
VAKKPTRVVFDEWQTYESETDIGLFFISFDVEAAREDLTATLPHCARVIIPIHDPNEGGGPVMPEAQKLWDMEDSLCNALSERGVDCRLVGRITHRGNREIVFQLDDWNTFRPPLDEWIQDQSDYDISVAEHEGWEFFNDMLRPTPETWLYIADRNVVQTLIKSGSNPEKVHSLEFVFLGGEGGLQKVVRTLTARGYQPLEQLDFASGQVVMTKKMKLDVNDIFEESLALSQLAEELGLQYDGWGCSVVK